MKKLVTELIGTSCLVLIIGITAQGDPAWASAAIGSD